MPTTTFALYCLIFDFPWRLWAMPVFCSCIMMMVPSHITSILSAIIRVRIHSRAYVHMHIPPLSSSSLCPGSSRRVPQQVRADRNHCRSDNNAKRRFLCGPRGRPILVHRNLSKGRAGDGLPSYRHLARGRPARRGRGRDPMLWPRRGALSAGIAHDDALGNPDSKI